MEAKLLKLEGRWEPAYPVEAVWDVMNDPTALAKYTPGCQKLEQIGPDTYEVALKVAIAGIGGSYQATMKKVDVVPLEHYGLKVDGKGPVGTVAVAGSFDFTAGDGKTAVSYAWDVSIGGPMAGVANRVLGGVTKVMLGQFLKDLEGELAERAAAHAADSAD